MKMPSLSALGFTNVKCLFFFEITLQNVILHDENKSSWKNHCLLLFIVVVCQFV